VHMPGIDLGPLGPQHPSHTTHRHQGSGLCPLSLPGRRRRVASADGLCAPARETGRTDMVNYACLLTVSFGEAFGIKKEAVCREARISTRGPNSGSTHGRVSTPLLDALFAFFDQHCMLCAGHVRTPSHSYQGGISRPFAGKSPQLTDTIMPRRVLAERKLPQRPAGVCSREGNQGAIPR